MFLGILVFLLFHTVEHVGNLLLSDPPFQPSKAVDPSSFHTYLCFRQMFLLPMLLRVFQAEAGTEDPQL